MQYLGISWHLYLQPKPNSALSSDTQLAHVCSLTRDPISTQLRSRSGVSTIPLLAHGRLIGVPSEEEGIGGTGCQREPMYHLSHPLRQRADRPFPHMEVAKERDTSRCLLTISNQASGRRRSWSAMPLTTQCSVAPPCHTHRPGAARKAHTCKRLSSIGTKSPYYRRCRGW